MPAPYLGGLAFTFVAWSAENELEVRFSSEHGSLYLVQLYAGRSLIGVSDDVDAREVIGVVQSSLWPEHLTLLAVTTANRNTDYGSLLPARPYNRVKLSYQLTSFPADSRWIQITGSSAPGEAVDPTNVLAREPFIADGALTFLTDPLEGSGEWDFEITGRDDTVPEGNLGDPLELSAEVLAHPPDLVLAGSSRFSVSSVVAGLATLTFQEAI